MPAAALIETLREYASDEPPRLPGFMGKLAMRGQRGPVRFIVTEDYNGQIEMSLSVQGPKRPTDAHVDAFFRAIGAQPLSAIKARGCIHFVMREGQRQ